jgi:hypothetical protein
LRKPLSKTYLDYIQKMIVTFRHLHDKPCLGELQPQPTTSKDAEGDESNIDISIVVGNFLVLFKSINTRNC